MTIDHLTQAMEHCNQGHLQLNNGVLHSFLYGGKWYPIRSVVNHAAGLAGEHPDWNVYQALYNLALIIPYLKIGDIEYEEPYPILLTDQEKVLEARLIAEALRRLVQP